MTAPEANQAIEPTESVVGALLRRVRRRLRATWAVEMVQVCAPLVAVAALLLTLASRLWSWRWGEPAAAVVPIGVVLVIVVAARAVRIPTLVAARAADRGLGTKDVFATALEVPADHGEFGSLVHARARELAADADAAAAVPWRFRRRPVIAAGVLAPVVVVLALIANPQDARREAAAKEQAAVDVIAADIAADADRLRADPAAADVVAQLDALSDELRRADDLDKAEELLQTELDRLHDQTSEALAPKAAAQGLERSLGSEPLPGATPQQTAAEQLAAAAAGLEQLSPEEAAALADRLDALANTQSVGDPAAAAALASAAASLRAGQFSAARAALGEAGQAQATASAEAASAATGDAAEAVARAAAAAAAAKSGKGAGAGAGQGKGSGQGQGSGSGQGSGQGSGSGSGAGQGGGQGGGGGGGSPSGNVSGGGGGKGQGGTGGQGQGTGTGGGTAGEEPDTETIFDPAHGSGGEEAVVGGGTGSGQGGTVGTANGPTNAGSSRVPVAEAIDSYIAAATQAMDRAAIPPAQRDLVLDYFDSLQGGS